MLTPIIESFVTYKLKVQLNKLASIIRNKLNCPYYPQLKECRFSFTTFVIIDDLFILSDHFSLHQAKEIEGFLGQQ